MISATTPMSCYADNVSGTNAQFDLVSFVTVIMTSETFVKFKMYRPTDGPTDRQTKVLGRVSATDI